jgi:translation initiation factor 4E
MLSLFQSIMTNLSELVKRGYDPIPSTFSKHPLKDSWSLWLFTNDRNKSWQQNQQLVTTFNTVDDCWGLFSSIKSPSESPNNITYSLFRESILPMWEDPKNLNGGRWIVPLDRHEYELIKMSWTNTILSLIAEEFEQFGLVCGAVIIIRSYGVKISLWVSNSCSTYEILEIGRVLKKNLHMCRCSKIEYKRHIDCVENGSSSAPAFLEI